MHYAKNSIAVNFSNAYALLESTVFRATNALFLPASPPQGHAKVSIIRWVLPLLTMALQLPNPASAAEYILPLDLAAQGAQAAIKQCESSGYHVTAAVVDSAGEIKALLKGDESTPHTRETAFRKAYTVVTMAPIFGFETSGQWAIKLRDNPNAAAFSTIPNIMPFAGAVAVRVHGKVVAAIGVGGAPGGEKDEACATAGLAKIKDQLPQ